MKVSETQKEIAKYLHELVDNTFAGVVVPLHLAKFIKDAGAAIGLNISTDLYNENNGTIGLHLA